MLFQPEKDQLKAPSSNVTDTQSAVNKSTKTGQESIDLALIQLSPQLSKLKNIAAPPPALTHDRRLKQWENLIQIALELKGQGAYSEALKHAKLALKISSTKLGLHGSFTCSTVELIGDIFVGRGDYAHANLWYQAALRLQLPLHDQTSPFKGRVQNKIGINFYTTGNYVEALTWFQRELQTYKQADSSLAKGLEIANHNIRRCKLADAHELHRTACVALESGQTQTAKKWFEACLTRYQGIAATNLPEYRDSLYSLGTIAFESRNYPDAERYFLKALQFNSHDSESILLRSLLAVAYVSMGESANAITLLEQAQNLRNQKQFYQYDLNLSAGYRAVAQNYASHKKYTAAELLLKQALQLCNSKDSAAVKERGCNLVYMGDLYCKHGKPEQGVQLLRQGYETLRSILPASDDFLAWAAHTRGLHCHSRARNLLRLGQELRKNESLPLSTEEVANILGACGGNDLNNKLTKGMDEALITVSAFAKRLEQVAYEYFEEAEEHYKSSSEISIANYGSSYKPLATIYSGLAALYTDLSMEPKAREYAYQAERIWKNSDQA